MDVAAQLCELHITVHSPKHLPDHVYYNTFTFLPQRLQCFQNFSSLFWKRFFFKPSAATGQSEP
jgi:hypothetical protein